MAIDLKAIDLKALKEEIKLLNDTGNLESKIKIVGTSKEKLVDAFGAAVDFLDDKEKESLSVGKHARLTRKKTFPNPALTFTTPSTGPKRRKMVPAARRRRRRRRKRKRKRRKRNALLRLRPRRSPPLRRSLNV